MTKEVDFWWSDSGKIRELSLELVNRFVRNVLLIKKKIRKKREVNCRKVTN